MTEHLFCRKQRDVFPEMTGHFEQSNRLFWAGNHCSLFMENADNGRATSYALLWNKKVMKSQERHPAPDAKTVDFMTLWIKPFRHGLRCRKGFTDRNYCVRFIGYCLCHQLLVGF